MAGFVSISKLPCLCGRICHLCSLGVLGSRLCPTFHFSCSIIVWAMSLFNFTSCKAILTGSSHAILYQLPFIVQLYQPFLHLQFIHVNKPPGFFYLIICPLYHLTRTTLCFILMASILASFFLGLLRTQDNITLAHLIPEFFSQDWV